MRFIRFWRKLRNRCLVCGGPQMTYYRRLQARNSWVRTGSVSLAHIHSEDSVVQASFLHLRLRLRELWQVLGLDPLLQDEARGHEVRLPGGAARDPPRLAELDHK